jgi:elongation factor Ts
MPIKISLDAIKALRDKTSASLNEVRQALEFAGGDEQKALKILKQRGAEIAQKRQGRATSQGRVESYLHHDGRLATMVEVNCETDFVARTPEFVQFCRDVAIQVAAMSPRYVRKEELPNPDRPVAEMLAACLLEQPFVKDPGTTIQALLTALIAKTGENVTIRRFARFAVGEALESTS